MILFRDKKGGPLKTADGTVFMPVPIRCPQCSSDRPFFTMLDLREYWFDAEGLKDKIAGNRLQCQECAHIFSVDKRGTFKHNRNCYPADPVPQEAPRRSKPDEDEGEMDPHPIPVPLRRPDA